jgi:hypothetical protein
MSDTNSGARFSAGGFIDETGKRFFRLTVIARAGVRRREAAWICKCDCGEETVATGHALRRGTKRSCGCGWRSQVERSRRPPSITQEGNQ